MMATENFGNFKEILTKIKNYGIIPVIKTGDANHAVSAAEALSSGGLNIAVISFNINANINDINSANDTNGHDCVLEALSEISGALPEGGGKLREQAETAAFLFQFVPDPYGSGVERQYLRRVLLAYALQSRQRSFF